MQHRALLMRYGPNLPEPFNQKTVDRIRYRVWLHWIRSVIDNGIISAMRHIWFPSRDLNVYEMRMGNPPADIDRPPHLRGLRLEIDATYIPDWLREFMRPDGKLDDLLNEAGRERGLEGNDFHRFRIELFDRVAKKFAEKGLHE